MSWFNKHLLCYYSVTGCTQGVDDSTEILGLNTHPIELTLKWGTSDISFLGLRTNLLGTDQVDFYLSLVFRSWSQPFWMSLLAYYITKEYCSPHLFSPGRKVMEAKKKRQTIISEALGFNLTSIGTKLWTLTFFFFKWQEEVRINWRERCVFLATILIHCSDGATPSVSPLATSCMDPVCTWPSSLCVICWKGYIFFRTNQLLACM